MGLLTDALQDKKVLVSDGGWGTMLQQHGLSSNDCPEEWNVSHPDEVRAVARAYAQAGSDLVLTNTFGGSRLKLAKAGLGDRVAELNAAGATNSLQAAEGALVAASVGPTGEFVEPLGTMTAQEMEDVFKEQIAALLEAGVRIICVETQSATEEAACAVRAAKSLDVAADVICTMTFNMTPKGPRTMMGVDPARAVTELTDAGADALGSNCGNGIEDMIKIAAEFASLSDKPILIHANAGVPQLIDGQTVFRQSPDDFAAHTRELIDAGARIIGGCCGTTPDHIAAMRAIVDAG